MRSFSPDEPERMDLPQPVSEELERDLDALEGINRRFGGWALWDRLAARWLDPNLEDAGPRPRRILDLCTGAGDGPRYFALAARKAGVPVEILGVDAHPSTLAIAARRSAGFPEIRFREGDARVFLPAPGEEWDFVMCSLALHHFSESDAVRVLRRMRELGRRGAAVLDLERGLVGTVGAWLLTTFIWRDPMTKHDARLSARRAWSAGELENLARTAGWSDCVHERMRWVARQMIRFETRARSGLRLLPRPGGG